MTSLPQIHIIGAGLAGLTLARCLRNKGIQTIIFERNASAAKHNYGITLKSRTCRFLGKVLGVDVESFGRKVGVDSLRGCEDEKRALRAHCGRLEGLLREGLGVEWGFVLNSIEDKENEKGYELVFEDKERVSTELVIDTSGVHSRVRKTLLPNSELDVLPYVVFRGTRRIDGSRFKEIYEAKFQNGNIIELRKDDVLLQVWINDHSNEEKDVDISYVYSRPTRDNDPLHRPGRAPGESSNINSTFFDEVSQISGLEQPFNDAFDRTKIKDDRILHWLMRTSLLSKGDLSKLGKKGVVFLGDSVHAMPILGGGGAGFAIEDAVVLADFIAERGVEGIEEFYEDRYAGWREGVRLARERLREMNLPSKSVL